MLPSCWSNLLPRSYGQHFSRRTISARVSPRHWGRQFQHSPPLVKIKILLLTEIRKCVIVGLACRSAGCWMFSASGWNIKRKTKKVSSKTEWCVVSQSCFLDCAGWFDGKIFSCRRKNVERWPKLYIFYGIVNCSFEQPLFSLFSVITFFFFVSVHLIPFWKKIHQIIVGYSIHSRPEQVSLMN